MKYPIFLFLVVLIFACDSKKTTHRTERIRFWYTTNYDPVPRDTFSFLKLKFGFPNSKDSLIASDLLKLKDTAYHVMIYSNEFDCPIDGDRRIIYVYGFGKVYYQALTWRNFRVLNSNNDSINNLISLFVAKGLQLTTEWEMKREERYKAKCDTTFFNVPPSLK